MSGQAPRFDEVFCRELTNLFAWRRDVRRFSDRPVERADLDALLALMVLAPSVGNSQPWRVVLVADEARRAGILTEFERCNHEAMVAYDDERAATYARLKLEGLREAPVQLAIFCDEACTEGHGLGRRTMPETLRYSVVMAIHTFWLAARARGLGVGWVSILDTVRVKNLLDVPESWSFIAYLCIGYPVEEHLDPELVRNGWQARQPPDSFLFTR